MQMTNKSEQRAFYKKKRTELEEDVKAQLDKKIYDIFLDFAKRYKDKLFLMYVSNGFEIDTLQIIEKLLGLDIKVAVPRCKIDSNKMDFYYINSLDDLEKGYFGILEPKSFCAKVNSYDASICVVPAICFDRQGFRIGYGKGFYDRFFNENSCFLKIGLCYENFIVDKIFADNFDIRVDYLLTESYMRERSKL